MSQVRRLAGDFAVQLNVQNKFKEGIPGYEWLRNLKKRWKDLLSDRVADNITRSKALACNVNDISKFANNLKEVIVRTGLNSKPKHIFNVYETGKLQVFFIFNENFILKHSNFKDLFVKEIIVITKYSSKKEQKIRGGCMATAIKLIIQFVFVLTQTVNICLLLFFIKVNLYEL